MRWIFARCRRPQTRSSASTTSGRSADGHRGPRREQPINRRVLSTRWSRTEGEVGPAPVLGSLLAFEIEANAFCHQMVRSLVGTLVDVGRGRKRPADMVRILRSADRQLASQPAPPQGLTLMEVRYPGFPT